MNLDFKIRDNIITYIFNELSSTDELRINNTLISGSEFKQELNFNVVNEHSITLNGKCVNKQLHSLFSNQPDKTIWTSGRHKDAETQAFIARQNAMFSSDLAFRCNMAVVLAYRALELGHVNYVKDSESIILELLPQCQTLTDSPSVRTNGEHVYFSLSYVDLLIKIFLADEKGFVGRLNDILPRTFAYSQKTFWKVSVGNIIKILMLVYMYLQRGGSSFTPSVSKLALYYTSLAYGEFKGDFSLTHFLEFKAPFHDTSIIETLSRLNVRGRDTDFRDANWFFKCKTVEEVELKLYSSALRVNANSKQLIVNFERFKFNQELAPAIQSLTKKLNL